MSKRKLSRRDALRAGALGTVGLAAGTGGLSLQALGQTPQGQASSRGTHHDMVTVGQLAPGSFDPTAFLTHFDGGRVSRQPSGQVLREY